MEEILKNHNFIKIKDDVYGNVWRKKNWTIRMSDLDNKIEAFQDLETTKNPKYAYIPFTKEYLTWLIEDIEMFMRSV